MIPVWLNLWMRNPWIQRANSILYYMLYYISIKVMPRRGRQGYQVFRQEVLVLKMMLTTGERIIDWQIRYRVLFMYNNESSIKGVE